MMQSDPVLEVRTSPAHLPAARCKAVDRVDLEVFARRDRVDPRPVRLRQDDDHADDRRAGSIRHPGEIRILRQDVVGKPPHKRNIGLVFQSLAVFPHMNVRRTSPSACACRDWRPLRSTSQGQARARTRPTAAAEVRRASPEASSAAGSCSASRSPARLVTEPALVLFDEPMAALDRRLRDYMAVELRAIQKQLGIAADLCDA